MTVNAQTILLFSGYVVLILACVLGMHYGPIDSQVGNLIIGGVLSHMGYVSLPNIGMQQQEKKNAE